MRFIGGLIIFWLTIFGTKLFMENKFKVSSKFSLALSYTFIGIYEFILGILNLMIYGSCIYVLLSIGYLFYLIICKKIKLKTVMEKFNSPTNLLCFIIFIYITFVGVNMHLMHYDNFSHWGLIVKALFQENRLPNFEDQFITFKGYQPGSACFIYLFGLLCGKNEGSMIVAQNYLIFSYITILFNFIKDKKYLYSILIICFYIFINTASLIGFNNLLVDSLIGVMTLGALLIIYYYKDNLKKAFWYSLLIVFYLLIVKNTGLILDGFICLYLLYIGYKNKKLKEAIRYIFIISFSLLFILLIWQGHVSLVYGHWALNTKHSLSPQNIYTSLTSLGINKIITFIVLYIKHLFSIKNNIPNIYIIVINILLVILASLSKNKKNVYKFLVVLDSIYLGYYLILGLMYILSMPWEEAKVLAGYERYMMTIVIILIGLFVVFIFNNKFKYKNIYLIVLSISLLIPIYFRYETFEILLGQDNYEGSGIEKLDIITKDIPKGNSYYIYSPLAKDDLGYLRFISIYKLFSNDVFVISERDELDKIEKGDYVIIFDDVDLKLSGKFKKIRDKIYRVDA